MPEVTEKQIIKVLRTIYDPEIPVNIYDIGLIYEIKISEGNNVYVKMTLTAPSCPVAGALPPHVEEQIRQLPGVGEVTVDLTWDPPWSMDLLSEAARLELGLESGGGY
ncbi:MAG: SUF system Fe-S cluster assembly protein [Bryobacterales bacterium]|nr:SUF system Fe-S cluster assembly protein [Bryobacterales bacterium]